MAPGKPPQPQQTGRANHAEDQRFETSRGPQYAATFVADILILIYGLGIGWSAIALPALTDPGGAANGTANGTEVNDTEGTALIITLEQGTWLTSIIYITAIPLMPLYSSIAERFGRKACGYLIGILFFISAVFQALASSFTTIQISRTMFGIASSGFFILVPLYISEIVEDAIRGRLGATIILTRNVGILMTYVLGTFLTYKQFEYVCIVPPVLFLVCFYWMPETPMHLLRHKKEAEAAAALRWLRGRRADVTRELEKMKVSLAAMNSAGARSATLKDLFATHGSRKAFCIGFLLSCNQQLCGFLGVVSYTFLIFEEASPALKDISNVIVGVMLVIGIAASMMIYDKVNRKVLLLVSNFVMIFSLLTMSGYFYNKQYGHDVSSYGWVPVTAMSVYMLGYNAGVAALPIVVLTEIFSPKVRNLGLTINGMLTLSIIFLVTKTFATMTEKIGFHGACWFYTSWCVLGIVVILTILPETRKRSLESIVDELEHGKKKNRIVDETAKEYEEKSLMNKENNGENAVSVL